MKTIILSLSVALLFACTVKNRLDNNLVAYWSFDDSSSIVIKDLSGHKLDALNKGAVPCEGRNGKALFFDGKSVLQVNYKSYLDSFTRGLTVAAWIKKDTASHWNTILSREIDSTWSEYFGLAVFKNHALFSVDPDGKKYINVMDSTFIIPDKWLLLAGTYDNDTFKLYVNGKLIQTGFCRGPLKFSDENPLLIGGNSNDKNHSTLDLFKGCIDEVKIYNKALSVEEITKLIK
jgi:hypothetical protein